MRFLAFLYVVSLIIAVVGVMNAEPCPDELEPLNMALYMGARIPRDLSVN